MCSTVLICLSVIGYQMENCLSVIVRHQKGLQWIVLYSGHEADWLIWAIMRVGIIGLLCYCRIKSIDVVVDFDQHFLFCFPFSDLSFHVSRPAYESKHLKAFLSAFFILCQRQSSVSWRSDSAGYRLAVTNHHVSRCLTQ